MTRTSRWLVATLALVTLLAGAPLAQAASSSTKAKPVVKKTAPAAKKSSATQVRYRRYHHSHRRYGYRTGRVVVPMISPFQPASAFGFGS